MFSDVAVSSHASFSDDAVSTHESFSHGGEDVTTFRSPSGLIIIIPHANTPACAAFKQQYPNQECINNSDSPIADTISFYGFVFFVCLVVLVFLCMACV